MATIANTWFDWDSGSLRPRRPLAEQADPPAGPELAVLLGPTLGVDSKAGVGAVLGAHAVSRSLPNAYSLLGSSIATQAFNAARDPKIAHDAAKNFA